MKTALIATLCLASGFAAGWLWAKEALYFSSLKHRNAMLHFNAEADVVFAMENIRSASNGDSAAIIQFNCRRAKSAVRLVDPLAYDDPQKQLEIAKIHSDALAMIESLTSSGQCGSGA